MLSSTYLQGTTVLAALSLGLSGVAGCDAGGHTGDDTQAYSGLDFYTLGNPYHSQQQQFLGSGAIHVSTEPEGNLLGDNNGDKLEDGAVIIGNTQAYFTAGIDLDTQSIQNVLSGSGSADVNFASVQADAGLDFALQNSADEHTGTYTLFARITPRKAVLRPKVAPVEGVDQPVTGTGKGLTPTSGFERFHDTYGSTEAFVDRVGDEFIQAIEYGSWLIVTLKIQYRNKNEKRTIGGRISVSWNNIDAEGGIDFEDSNDARRVKISLHARQLGGDNSRLAEILPNNLIECSPDNLSVCSDIFSEAIRYLRDEYPTQFVDSDGNVDLTKYRHVRYITARYDESGPNFTPYIAKSYDRLSFNSRQKLRLIDARWETERQNQRRTDYLLRDRASELHPVHEEKLREVKSMVSANIDKLASMAKECREGGPDTCVTVWESQLSELHAYSDRILEL